MALLTIRGLTFGYGGPPLLDAVDLSIDERERVALVGRNGAGKSTLLKLLGGEIDPESGQIVRGGDVAVTTLGQDVPLDLSG